MRSVLLTALAVGIGASACQPSAPEVGPLSREDLEMIGEVRDRFVEAELRGAWAEQAELYTVDAVLLDPDGPVVAGRAAIQAGLEEFDIVLDDFTLTSMEVEGGGGQAYDRGIYSLEYFDLRSQATARETGNYVIVLRKQTDGSWLIAALIHNSGQPLSEPGSSGE